MTTLFIAIGVLNILGIVFELSLAMASKVFTVTGNPKVDDVNAALPQVN